MADESTLIIGESGQGKTNFALTFPKPAYIWDLDGKARDALPGRLDDVEVTEFHDPPMPEALQMRLRGTRDKPTIKVIPKDKPEAYRSFIADLNRIWNLQTKERPYRTIILDSWSELATVATRDFQCLKGEVGMPLTQPDYGTVQKKFEEVLPVLYGIPCDHLVVTAHERMDQDEETHVHRLTPWSIGRAFAPMMPRKFSNVLRCVANWPNYTVWTRAKDLFRMGKTKWASWLPLVCPSDWEEIMSLVEENQERDKTEQEHLTFVR